MALPYDTTTHRDELLARIKDGLDLAVAANDFSVGALLWTKQIHAFQYLKYDIPLESRLHLIKILFELAVMPNMEAYPADVFAALCMKLLRKRHLIPIDSLQLDWRPLWNCLQKVHFPRSRERVLPGALKRNTIAHVTLAQEARRYFSPTATAEILEEFLPDFNVNQMTHSFNILCVMNILLPVDTPPAPLAAHFQPEGVKGPAFYWIPTIFSIWSYAGSIPNLDVLFIDLLGRLAKAQVASPWNVGWTEDQVNVIFAAGMRCLNLPVGSGNSTGAAMAAQARSTLSHSMLESLFGKTEKVKVLARFVIYTLFPDPVAGDSKAPPRTGTMTQLKKLIQATEGFFNPSNSGAWSLKLATMSIREEFVFTLRGVTYLSMFSKDHVAVAQANNTLKNLCIMEPSLVVPGLLERIYPGLETVTETHRTWSCIANISQTIIPILRRSAFPSGGTHLLALLNLMLPAIDINDPMKTSNCLFFIMNALMTVPVMDLTETDDTPDNEDDEGTRLSTAGFESWALLYLDRIFTMFENLPELHGSQGRKRGGRDSIEASIMKLTAKFLFSNVIPTATKTISYIAEASMGGNQEQRLKAMLPTSIARIRSEITGGASAVASIPSSSNPYGFASMSDAALHWNQCIFNHSILMSGPALLKMRKEVSDCIEDQITNCKSFRGVKWAAKSLRFALFTLTSIYVTHEKTYKRADWENPNFMKTSYKRWGELESGYDVDVDWHIPSDEELDFAVELLDVHHPRCVAALEAIIASPPPVSSTSGAADLRRASAFEISRWLTILRNINTGVSSVIPPYADEDARTSTPARVLGYNCKPFPISDAGYMDPSHRLYSKFKDIRRRSGDILVKVAKYLLHYREDDIACNKDLLKAITLFISERGSIDVKVSNLLNSYRMQKGMAGSVESDKRLPRHLHLKRIYGLHLKRLNYFGEQAPQTPVVEAIVDCIAQLCISRYAEVRVLAQGAISKVLIPHQALRSKLYFFFVSKMQEDGTVAEHVVRGAVHTLLKKTFLESIGVRYSDCAAALFLALTKTRTESNPTILELIRQLFLEFMGKYTEFSYGLKSTQRVLAAVPGSKSCNLTEVSEALDVWNRVEAAKDKTYRDLVKTMIERIGEPGAHWRAVAMGINLVELLLRPDDPVPASLVKIAIRGIVSDHPTMRIVCLNLILIILTYLKARAKKLGTDRTALLRKVVENAGVSRAETDAYLDASVVKPAWGETDLHDSTIAPPSFDLDAMSPIESLPFWDPTSAEALNVILEEVTQSDFWMRAARFLSQESSGGQEAYNPNVSRFIRCLAGQFEDRFIEAGFKSQVTELLSNPAENSKQRAGAELVGGLLRGSKHWTEAKMTKLWEWLTPLMTKVFHGATMETLAYLGEMLGYAASSRDPRRYLPILQIILNWKMDPTSQSFFTETKKLLLVRLVYTLTNWRLNRQIIPILKAMVENARNPYKQTRETMGAVMDEIIQHRFYPSADSVSVMVGWNLRAGFGVKVPLENPLPGMLPLSPDPELRVILDGFFASIAAWRVQVDAENKDYASACKTGKALYLGQRPGAAATFIALDYVVPELPHMMINDDKDLQSASAAIASLYPTHPHPLRLVPMTLNRLMAAITSQHDWHTRLRLLPSLQVFFFKHLHLISSEDAVKIVSAIGELLEDAQMEVRQMAAVTLSGLIRCSQRDAISVLKTKFEKMLAATKAAKKRATLPARPASPAISGNDRAGSPSSSSAVLALL
ncbi:hypothetical protein HK101_009690 [Irineochytrium annulatum]|nr:hypothetical protein HK101_009690 [Irineochytrium annulatum]